MSPRTLVTPPVLIALVALAVLVAIAARPEPASADMSALERDALELVNAERTQRGLDPLVPTSTLDQAASWMAWDMSTTGGISHTDTLGRGLRDRLNAFGYPSNSSIRENVAAGGIFADPAAVVDAWMNSSGHRANILAANVKAIGVGLHVAPGTSYRNFWVLNFGSKIDTPPPAGAAPANPTPTATASPTPSPTPTATASPTPAPSPSATPSPTATPSPSPTPTAGPAPTPAAPTQPAPAVVTGPIPRSGVALLRVEEQAAAEQIVETALAAGCARPSVWVTQGGALVGYVGGAPAFVNAAFPAAVPAASPILLSCG